MASAVPGPLKDAARHYIAGALARYWPSASEAIAALEFPRADILGGRELPPALHEVVLPEWGAACGVAGRLLVPAHAVVPGEAPAWERTDWLAAAFWYLNATAEREHEARHGPIHSYAVRLRGWPPAMWQRAWVNRVALFLRRCAARARQASEEQLFGPAPRAEFVLTHDVDAIEKTAAIRIKQGAFHAFNALRRLVRADLAGAGRKARAAARFVAGAGSYWNFSYLESLEAARGWRSQFNVYGGGGGWRRSPLALLMDPGYDVAHSRLAGELRSLHERGFTIGLHQSFGAWSDARAMKLEKERVERALGVPVRSCRQHWLRFGWRSTWAAQEAAGLALDTTLGFNDRPGFRVGAALRFRPFDAGRGEPLQLEALPTVLMDSHVYDYAAHDAPHRRAEIGRWVGEIAAVGGSACLNWHVHTVSDDYGWRDGYEDLAAALSNA